MFAYIQFITFETNKEKKQGSFRSVGKIPTVEEWNNFVAEQKLKDDTDWVIVNTFTISLI